MGDENTSLPGRFEKLSVVRQAGVTQVPRGENIVASGLKRRNQMEGDVVIEVQDANRGLGLV